MKEKPNSTRLYDEEGFRKRAACICVRGEAQDEVLLVTSSRRPETWIVPGGGVEPEETPSVTAIREVLEEAGVVGKLGRSLGVFEDQIVTLHSEFRVQEQLCRLSMWDCLSETIILIRGKSVTSSHPLRKHELHKFIVNMERKHRTEVFVMVVNQELPEWEDAQAMNRKRKWFTMDEALKQLALNKPAQLTYLQSMLSLRDDKVT